MQPNNNKITAASILHIAPVFFSLYSLYFSLFFGSVSFENPDIFFRQIWFGILSQQWLGCFNIFIPFEKTILALRWKYIKTNKHIFVFLLCVEFNKFLFLSLSHSVLNIHISFNFPLFAKNLKYNNYKPFRVLDEIFFCPQRNSIDNLFVSVVIEHEHLYKKCVFFFGLEKSITRHYPSREHSEVCTFFIRHSYKQFTFF